MPGIHEPLGQANLASATRTFQTEVMHTDPFIPYFRREHRSSHGSSPGGGWIRWLALFWLAGAAVDGPCGGRAADAGAGLARTRARMAAHQPTTIVCLGDSVTGIYYHTGGAGAYPELLALALKQGDPAAPITVINAGISGHTTVQALERLQKDVLDHHPSLVTVMFGLNDVVRVPRPEFQSNLATLIQRCRASHAEVLLCTPNGVMENASRPRARLQDYNATLHEVARQTGTPVCDIYAAYEALRGRDPSAFRRLCSDEIHPNLDGHALTAEALARSITGNTVALQSLDPVRPGIPRTRARWAARQPVRVLAMAPFDQWIGPALRSIFPGVDVMVSPWPTAGQTLAQLHTAAKAVRGQAVDLVVIAVPGDITPSLAAPTEADLNDHSWILNFSLSFGRREWDVIGVAPSVLAAPRSAGEQDRDNFARRMLAAQGLRFAARAPGQRQDAAALLAEFLRQESERSHP